MVPWFKVLPETKIKATTSYILQEYKIGIQGDFLRGQQSTELVFLFLSKKWVLFVSLKEKLKKNKTLHCQNERRNLVFPCVHGCDEQTCIPGRAVEHKWM